MLPLQKVKEIVSRYNSLEKELSSGNVDPKKFVNKSKEYSNLGNIILIAKEYINFDNEKKDLEQILQDKSSDKEIIEMAQKDLDDLHTKRKTNENQLKIFLLPKDEDDSKNAIVEIRAGTGGLEASLFCSDLFKMYEKVCSKKKWQLEIINISKSDAGALRKLSFQLMEMTFTLILNMSLAFIAYKGYLKLKHRDEYILQLLQWLSYPRQRR